MQQQRPTCVGFPIAADTGDAVDPTNLQGTGLPNEATTESPLVHQCYDEVSSRQHAGLQLPNGNGALLDTDSSAFCFLQDNQR